MRTLAVVSGASRDPVDRSPGRVVWFLARLAELGPVDLVVVHDDAVDVEHRRAWTRANLGTAVVAEPTGFVAERVIEVATAPPKRSGVLREVHLRHSDAPERQARRMAWFRVVDSFVASAPGPHDVVWCADLTALTRAEWSRRSPPAVADVDRGEALGRDRDRRSARRAACVAHLVTLDTPDRRDQLALPGSLVVAPDDGARFADHVATVVSRASAYRPARTS
jgi:hypothetical protein